MSDWPAARVPEPASDALPRTKWTGYEMALAVALALLTTRVLLTCVAGIIYVFSPHHFDYSTSDVVGDALSWFGVSGDSAGLILTGSVAAALAWRASVAVREGPEAVASRDPEVVRDAVERRLRVSRLVRWVMTLFWFGSLSALTGGVAYFVDPAALSGESQLLQDVGQGGLYFLYVAMWVFGLVLLTKFNRRLNASFEIFDTDDDGSIVDGDGDELVDPLDRSTRGRWVLGVSALLMAGAVAAVVVAAVSGPGTPRPRPAAGGSFRATGFSARPVICYAPAYVPLKVRPVLQMPTCGRSHLLNRANLQVTPSPNPRIGYTVATVAPDGNDAWIPSTTLPLSRQPGVVIMRGLHAASRRYVLGEVALTSSDITLAKAERTASGQWVVAFTLTSTGSYAWDALARDRFHEIVAFVVDDRVVFAPLIQPAQSTFSSFGGSGELVGGFTHREALIIASSMR